MQCLESFPNELDLRQYGIIVVVIKIVKFGVMIYMFDDTYTPKIFQVRELNSSLFSPSQFVKATGRAYILDNVQSLIQTSRPLTIDH